MKACSTAKVVTWLFAWLLGLFLLPGPSSGEVSFKGKTISVIVATNAGGGTDLAGRLILRFMKKYLPGNPRFLYRYMGAGGGKIKAGNYMATRAKPDGLTMMVTDSHVVYPHVFRSKVAKFNPQDFRPIGGLNRGGSIIFVRKAAYKRLYNRSAKPVIVGAISGSRNWNAQPVWGGEFLGWNVKWIPGYRGTTALIKAILQGEIDMFGTGNAYIIRDLKDQGVVDLISQEGILLKGKYSARSSFQDVPVFPDLLLAKKPTKLQWKGYLSWVGPGQMDKWQALPPGTPQKFVQAYRQAFSKVVKDPEFQKLASKQFSVDITPMYGKDLEKIIKDAVAISRETLEYASRLRKKYGVPER